MVGTRRDKRHDVLFEPIRIGPKVLKNRFYQVPHCIGAGTERPGSQAMHRSVKAEGGWAAVCTEACGVNTEADFEPHRLASLWDADDITNLRYMCDEAHKWGALAGVELWHSGGVSPCLDSRAVPRAPSQFMTPYTPHCAGHEMSEGDIEETLKDYIEAARRAVEAGFDIVYSYGSHSVLPFQFLSKWYNKRRDGWGGTFENRSRFWFELTRRLKRAVGDCCAVAVRMSVDQLIGPAGLEVLDEGLRFVELMTHEGLVDLWDVNICDQFEWGEDAGSSRFYGSNHQAPFVKHVKGVASVPVLNVGRLTSPDDMVRIIESGQADIIGAARPSIADPFLPRKIEEGRVEDIRECIGCNTCIARWERGARMICTQNATAMEEHRRGWHPEIFDHEKRSEAVLVVGAGPAGLECARVLGSRGYTVHLVEAEEEVGGHLRYVVKFPGLSEWGRVVSYRENQLRKLRSVTVHKGHRLSVDDILDYGAEIVVLATGAHWVGNGLSYLTMEALPNVDSSAPQFVTPEQLMSGKQLGDRVVVLDADGYYMGYSCAEVAARQGKQVTLITPFPQPAPWTAYTLEAPAVQRTLREKGIKTLTGMWIEHVEKQTAIRMQVYDLYRDAPRRAVAPARGVVPRVLGTAAVTVEADSVVLVTERSSNGTLYRQLDARASDWDSLGIKGVYQAGDCYAPRHLADAIFEGHRIGRELGRSSDPQRPLPYKRERFVWHS
jgi:dimethylamine/trimethylamine dehydrogenase